MSSCGVKRKLYRRGKTHTNLHKMPQWFFFNLCHIVKVILSHRENQLGRCLKATKTLRDWRTTTKERWTLHCNCYSYTSYCCRCKIELGRFDLAMSNCLPKAKCSPVCDELQCPRVRLGKLLLLSIDCNPCRKIKLLCELYFTRASELCVPWQIIFYRINVAKQTCTFMI